MSRKKSLLPLIGCGKRFWRYRKHVFRSRVRSSNAILPTRREAPLRHHPHAPPEQGRRPTAIYRSDSSIGVIGHASVVLLVAQDPYDDQKRVLAVTTCNLAAKPRRLRFALDPE
jgi:hypothetical protein